METRKAKDSSTGEVVIFAQCRYPNLPGDLSEFTGGKVFSGSDVGKSVTIIWQQPVEGSEPHSFRAEEGDYVVRKEDGYTMAVSSENFEAGYTLLNEWEM